MKEKWLAETESWSKLLAEGSNDLNIYSYMHIYWMKRHLIKNKIKIDEEGDQPIAKRETSLCVKSVDCHGRWRKPWKMEKKMKR